MPCALSPPGISVSVRVNVVTDGTSAPVSSISAAGSAASHASASFACAASRSGRLSVSATRVSAGRGFSARIVRVTSRPASTRASDVVTESVKSFSIAAEPAESPSLSPV